MAIVAYVTRTQVYTQIYTVQNSLNGSEAQVQGDYKMVNVDLIDWVEVSCPTQHTWDALLSQSLVLRNKIKKKQEKQPQKIE